MYQFGASAIFLFKSPIFKNQRKDSMDVVVFFLCVFVLGQLKEEMVSGEDFSVI